MVITSALESENWRFESCQGDRPVGSDAFFISLSSISSPQITQKGMVVVLMIIFHGTMPKTS